MARTTRRSRFRLTVVGRGPTESGQQPGLYAENTRDSYHASLLHLFHTTFGIYRSSLGAGVFKGLFQFGSLPQALATKNIELFAKTVLPALRRE